MSATRLLRAGAGLLGLSLLGTLVVATSAASSPSVLVLQGWFTQVTLLVGSGLVVGGAVLRGLLPGRDSDDRTRDVDHYG